MQQSPTIIYEAAAIIDAAGTAARPGAVAVCDGRIVASGYLQDVRAITSGFTHLVNLGDVLIMPGLVNAHAHLDLTPVGTQTYTGRFLDWVAMVIQARPTTDEAVANAINSAAGESYAAGVAHIGDITPWPNNRAPREALQNSPLTGISFTEMIGRDSILPDRIDAIKHLPDESIIGGIRPGLQPHAPYSTDIAIYALTAEAGLPATTHLAEMSDELEFVASATGPFRDHLENIGKWNDAYASHYSIGQTPVQWMQPFMRRCPWLLAHANYVDDDDLEILADTNASVAYCPIASEYFGHRDHRYRDMLAAGINVCLGTDSIVCQPAAERQPLGILSQMRRLYQRDHTDPTTLLTMATINGCKALHLDPNCATLLPGVAAAPANLFTVRLDPANPADALTQVLQNRYPVDAIKNKEYQP